MQATQSSFFGVEVILVLILSKLILSHEYDFIDLIDLIDLMDFMDLMHLMDLMHIST